LARVAVFTSRSATGGAAALRGRAGRAGRFLVPAVFLAPALDFVGFREAELLFAPLVFLAPDDLVVRAFDRPRGFRTGAIASYTILRSSDPGAADLCQALPVAIST
jgi:hypothetical protein